jgi:HK97 family phage prohead protease
MRIETGQREQRAVTLDSVEFRKADDGKLSFRGHAAVFDEWTQIGPKDYGFQERIARGAFRKVLSDGADVRFLINHDGLPLARTAAGTMTLKEDTKGLRVDADLAPTTLANDLAVLLERRDISQMSFGFRVGKHEVEHDEENDEVRRTITEFSDLYDVSPVTFPAYEGTDAALRAALAGEMTEAQRATLEALAGEIGGRLGLKAEREKPQMGRTAAWCRVDLLELEQAA